MNDKTREPTHWRDFNGSQLLVELCDKACKRNDYDPAQWRELSERHARSEARIAELEIALQNNC
jgi:hypothetical protein